MKTANFLTSSCRYCRYYGPEGRRGGVCQQLGVPVQAQWKACNLAARPFSSAWESLEEVMRLESSLSLNYSVEEASTPVPDADEVIAGSRRSGGTPILGSPQMEEVPFGSTDDRVLGALPSATV